MLGWLSDRNLRGSHALAILVGSMLCVGYLFGPNLAASWSAFDDHEIMSFLGQSDHLPLSQFTSKLMQTEVGSQSSTPRFRPVYYALRLLEAWAWGNQPADWYAAHLTLLLIFVVTIWMLATTRIGWLASGLVAVYALSFHYWSGIFATLGPGEAYAVLGLALYLIGVDRVYGRPGAGSGWWFLLLGTVIAAGSKENFVLLVLPTLFLLGQSLRIRTVSWAAWPTSALALLWSAWITYTVTLKVRAAGANIYGTPVGIGHSLRVLVRGLGDPRLILFYAAVFAFGLLWWYWRRRAPATATLSWICAVGVMLLISTYISQVVFYDGAWPTGTRYDFPGLLVWPALLLVVIWYLQRLAVSLPPASPWRRTLNAAAIFIAVLAIAVSIPGLANTARVSAANARSTAAFTTLIGRIAEVASANRGYPVVLQSNDPADFEPLTSYAQFLRSASVSNDMFLLWIPRRPGVSNYQGSLSDQLTNMSERGVPGLFLPIAQLDSTSSACILVVLAGPTRWPCQIQIPADWRPFY